MNECELQKVYNHQSYPRDSKTKTDKAVGIIDNGSIGGSPWNYCKVKDNKSYSFRSLGKNPE